MAQVSVGQVENLEEALGSIIRAQDSLGSSCDQINSQLREKREEAEKEEQESNHLLESATEIEADAAATLEAAQESLIEANAGLAAANSALSSCGSEGPAEDGEPPDCSSEESDVDAAESEVTSADLAVDQAAESLELAKAERMRMGNRVDLVRQALFQISEQEAAFQSASRVRLKSASNLADHARCRIGNARATLDEYLAQNPAAAPFAEWVSWTPKPNTVFTPAHFNERLNLPSRSLGEFVKYLSERDSHFRSKLSGYHEKLEACNGPVERHAVQLQMRRNLAGEVAEQFVVRAISPLGEEVVLQHRTELPNGSYTKTDFVLKGLKVPAVLGRGEGRYAGVGESIAGEIKCGKASYIYREKDHMVTQSFGHQAAAASLTICSRDVKDLQPDEEVELRDALKEAGSPLVGMLPRKEEVDRACWQAVTEIPVGKAEKPESRKVTYA